MDSKNKYADITDLSEFITLNQHTEEFKKDKIVDEIKNAVVLLFLQYFPDDHAEERLQWFSKYGRWRNYNESALIFERKGGMSILDDILDRRDESISNEGDTIPLLDLLELIRSSKGIIIKANNGLHKNICLDKRSTSILEGMITEYLDWRVNPYYMARLKAITYEEKNLIDRFYSGRQKCSVKIDWHEDLSKMKAKLQEWHNEKIRYKKGKDSDYYYSFWESIIPWRDDQTITDRMIFLYRLGLAFKLESTDCSVDLNNCYDRKEISDKLKYKIKSQREWESNLEKKQ